MAEAIVSDWLAEYNSLEPQEIRSFAALHAENHELSTAIHSILNDKTKHSEVRNIKCYVIVTKPPFTATSFNLHSTLQLLSIKRKRAQVLHFAVHSESNLPVPERGCYG